MFSEVQKVIEAGGYDLADLLHRIDVLFAWGRLTQEERDELVGSARANAVASDSYAPLEQRVSALELRVDALERSGSTEPGPGEGEGWPEFVQPTGAHDSYDAGDRVTYEGKRYTCLADGTVWAPDVYPDAWREETGEA